jgi:hypothetical protein
MTRFGRFLNGRRLPRSPNSGRSVVANAALPVQIGKLRERLIPWLMAERLDQVERPADNQMSDENGKRGAREGISLAGCLLPIDCHRGGILKHIGGAYGREG